MVSQWKSALGEDVVMSVRPRGRRSSLGMWEGKYMLQRSVCVKARRAMWTRLRPLPGTSMSMFTNMEGQPNLHMLSREFCHLIITHSVE